MVACAGGGWLRWYARAREELGGGKEREERALEGRVRDPVTLGIPGVAGYVDTKSGYIHSTTCPIPSCDKSLKPVQDLIC